ncbi:MAG: biotin--[acetyl-CoA-carboxylase] ligase [Pseudomonadota bacterium]
MSNPFSIQDIAAFSRPAARYVQLQVIAETGSTNADLMAAIHPNSKPTLLIAEAQTAGRGRAGRSWLSAPQASLTFSLAWNFALPVQALLGLPLAVGVAIAETLAAFDVFVQLKWPNDVLKDGKKLAGILIETMPAPVDERGYDSQELWAVIGIGLNLLMPDELEAQIGQAAASIPWLAQLDRNVLMAALLSTLCEALAQFETEGFPAFEARWNRLHAFAGQPVAIMDQGHVLQQGIAFGVDAAGCLLLDTAAGRIAVVAGDVSLRVQQLA